MDEFNEDAVKVPFGTKFLDAALSHPSSVKDVHTAVILTHGAGGDMNFKHLVSLARALASHGVLCLRFTCKGLNLGYRVKAFRAVWDFLKSLQKFSIKNVFVGGRSMGCRAAAALARQLSDESEDAVQGVICLSFPLHPPAQTHVHQQRSEDLRRLPERMPVLFVSGSEDNMCERVLFDATVKEMKAQVEVFWLTGGSHGLTVKGRSEDSVMDEVNLQVTAWINKQETKSMAGEPWNSVNIAFPSAVSSVRVHFSATTDANVRAALVENEKLLKLIRSEVFQTEVRVLYELLYILNNSYRGNRTYKGLQQVEQCINRLKIMKLDVALQELTELCPNRIQRGLSIKAGECDVPSQPFLEWLCLKVLGAAQLMSCTLSRCSRAFSLTKQQMKWEEFIILNVVITSMLSRLWVICRGILVSLSTLYQPLLQLLREVASAQPMPFLTDFSLPADMAQFLGPSDALLVTKRLTCVPHTKEHKEKQQSRKKSSVKVKNQEQTRKVKEDLGVAIERGVVSDTGLKPFLKVFRNFTKKTHKADKKQKFKKQVRETTTFTDMVTHLEEMIQWCKSQKMEKEKRLLTFLRLKCQRLKCLEAAGYNLQRKLRTFRQAAFWASSPRGSVPRTCRSSVDMGRNDHLRTRFHSLRSRFKSSAMRAGVKKKQLKRQRKRTELSVTGLLRNDQRSRSAHKTTPQTTDSEVHDDIDDIFASVGL
ncbi:nucleolus and neural progenitor protein-like [Symphorus nematophorus]